MATLTVHELESRLSAVDDELRAVQPDYRRLADAATRADNDREEAIARVFGETEGNHYEKRQAAILAVGSQGLETRASYARLAADVKILDLRIVALSTLLKSAKGREASARYHDGP